MSWTLPVLNAAENDIDVPERHQGTGPLHCSKTSCPVPPLLLPELLPPLDEPPLLPPLDEPELPPELLPTPPLLDPELPLLELEVPPSPLSTDGAT
jgi:hypothetical protein